MFRLIGAATLTLAAGAAIAQTDNGAARRPPQKESAASVNARVMAPLPADQAAMKAHVMFLASDAMRGREAGSPEFDIAAQYVAAQFYAAGLRPGGDDGGYLQRVPLVGYKLADKGNFVWTPRQGRAADAGLRRGFRARRPTPPRPKPASARRSCSSAMASSRPTISATIIKGVDVKGKIVAYVGGAPKGYDGEERAFFSSAGTKAADRRRSMARSARSRSKARASGAAHLPFAATARAYDRERVTWSRARRQRQE